MRQYIMLVLVGAGSLMLSAVATETQAPPSLTEVRRLVSDGAYAEAAKTGALVACAESAPVGVKVEALCLVGASEEKLGEREAARRTYGKAALLCEDLCSDNQRQYLSRRGLALQRPAQDEPPLDLAALLDARCVVGRVRASGAVIGPVVVEFVDASTERVVLSVSTTEEGEFVAARVPFGAYKLRITSEAFGLKDVASQLVKVTNRQNDVDLGPIDLAAPVVLYPRDGGSVREASPTLRLALPVDDSGSPVFFYALRLKALPNEPGQTVVQFWSWKASKDRYLQEIPYNLNGTAGPPYSQGLLPGRTYLLEVDLVRWDALAETVRRVRQLRAEFRYDPAN